MDKKKIFAVFMLTVMVLSACGQAAKTEPTAAVQPTQAASPVAAEATTVSEAPAATAAPTNTPEPTATPVPVPITLENVSNLVEAGRYGKGKVLDLAYSADGASLAIATAIGIYIYDPTNWSEKLFINTGVAIGSIAYAPDGSMIAAGGDDGKIQLLQTSDGSLVRTLEGHKGRITSLAFSPDGITIASGATDRTLRFWKVADGTQIRNLEQFYLRSIPSMVFSPDSAVLATGGQDPGNYRILTWLVSTGGAQNSFMGHTDAIQSVAYSPDGALLASGSLDGSVILWDAKTGSLINTLLDTTPAPTDTAPTPGTQPGAATEAAPTSQPALTPAGATDTTATPISATPVSVSAESGTSSPVYSVVFSYDGALLVAGHYDGTIRLWNVSDGSLQRKIDAHTALVGDVVISPDGKTLVSVLSMEQSKSSKSVMALY